MITFTSPQHEKNFREHLASFDRDAHLMVDGQKYELTLDDLREVAAEGQYFHCSPGHYNSSVTARLVDVARRRFGPKLVRAQVLALCAATLRTTVDAVEHSLDFTANYMAMHDGTTPEENHPYARSEP